MNKNIIKKLINIWDPLGVFGLGPEDEYDNVIASILNLLDTDVVDENKVKKYLLNQYYSEIAKNKEKVNELYDILLMVRKFL